MTDPRPIGIFDSGVGGLTVASAIMEALGWKSVAMLRRYLGKISVTRLKSYPMTLSRVFGPAA